MTTLKLATAAAALMLLAAPAQAADWVCPKEDPLLTTGCAGLEHYTLAMQALDRTFKLIRAKDPAFKVDLATAADEMGFVQQSMTAFATELSLIVRIATEKGVY